MFKGAVIKYPLDDCKKEEDSRLRGLKFFRGVFGESGGRV